MLTLAYLGNGKSTNRYHLPYVLTDERFRVRTIWSRNAPQRWVPQDGIRYTTRLEEVWDDPAIDLVVVATVSHTHAALARQALEQGKHVLVEKPFAATSAETRELFDLALARGLFLQCYQNRRFDSDYLTTQSVIASGRLGELLEVEMHFDYFRPETPLRISPTFSLDTSFLMGHGSHTVDQALAAFGRPCHVQYDVRQLVGPGGMNDYFDIDLLYDGPLKVSVKSSYFRVVPRPSFVVHGTRGHFVKTGKDRQEEHLKLGRMPGSPGFGEDRPEHWGALTYLDDQGGLRQELVPTITGDYGLMYDAVHRSIVDGEPKSVTDEQTIAQIEILEQGIRRMRCPSAPIDGLG